VTASLANSLLWLVVSLVLFLLAQRWLHQQIQLLFYLLTRRLNLALALFSILFLPGVLLHETSHYVVARLLGVRTRRFSIIPQVTVDARLRLGYVETAQADVFRDTLIGAAPFLFGGAVVAYLGISQLGIAPLFDLASQGSWAQVWSALAALPERPDFWLWFYLTFTISSMMLPSPADRRAWLPVVLVLLAIAALALLAGAGPWIAQNVAPWLDRILRAVATVLGIGLMIHLFLAIPVTMLRIVVTMVRR
jgi:hypothetical protein